MRVEDIVDIQQVEALYSHAVDCPDQGLLPLVFAENAVFDGRPCGSGIYEGCEAIAAWFALGKPPHPLAHHLTNCWVHEDNGRVLVKAKAIFRHPLDGSVCFADYDDEMVRTAEGWRIQRRVVTPRDPPLQPGPREPEKTTTWPVASQGEAPL